MGCLGVTLLLLVVSGGLINWFLRETPILPGDSLLGKSTTSFAIVHVDEQDPGMRALLHTVFTHEAADGEDARRPISLEAWWLRLIASQTATFLPLQIVLVQEPGSDGHSLLPAMVVSFPRAGLVRLSYWSMRRYAMEHGARVSGPMDAEILAIPPEVVGPAAPPGSITYVMCVRNNVVLSTSPEQVTRMAERLSSPSSQFAGSRALAALYHRLNPRQDLLGVVSNEHGEVRRLLQVAARSQEASRQTSLPELTPEAIEAAAEGIKAVGMEIDLLGEDEMDVHVVAACRNPPFAAEARAMLEQVADALVRSGIAQKGTAVADDRLVDAHLRVVKLRDILQRKAGTDR